MTALKLLKNRMDIDFIGSDHAHRLGDRAMHPSAPSTTRRAALILLAHGSARRRRALPGTPWPAPTGASNCGFQVVKVIS
ncbi:MAG: hypothetical protein JSS05_07220 [Proteobacteria bacterium]|nr:hypothetical protein [Pseudomonadota bacterium]